MIAKLNGSKIGFGKWHETEREQSGRMVKCFDSAWVLCVSVGLAGVVIETVRVAAGD